MTTILLIIIIVLIVGYARQLTRNRNGFEICTCHDCIEARNHANLQKYRERQAQPWHARNRSTLAIGTVVLLVIIAAFVLYREHIASPW